MTMGEEELIIEETERCEKCSENHDQHGKAKCNIERQQLIKKARIEYGCDEIEIDGDAKISRGDDGIWVQAWVLLHHDEIPKGDDEEN
jgi:hypothetical protein